jgi:hypothetical protein
MPAASMGEGLSMHNSPPPPVRRGETNPFQAMDAGLARGGPLEAGGQSAGPANSSANPGPQLQVGYQDPVLGYVELRAHSNGGGVHASLGAESNAAGATLSGDLPALTAWMDARHTPVETLSVVALHGSEVGSLALANAHGGPGTGGGQGLAHGSGQNSDPGGSSGGSPGSPAGSHPGSGQDSDRGSRDTLPTGSESRANPAESGPMPAESRSSPPGWEVGFPGESSFAGGSSISVLA